MWTGRIVSRIGELVGPGGHSVSSLAMIVFVGFSIPYCSAKPKRDIRLMNIWLNSGSWLSFKDTTSSLSHRARRSKIMYRYFQEGWIRSWWVPWSWLRGLNLPDLRFSSPFSNYIVIKNTVKKYLTFSYLCCQDFKLICEQRESWTR